MSDATRQSEVAWGISSGFPRNQWRPSSQKPLRLLILPLLFKDIRFSDTDRARVVAAANRVSDYYRSVSYGRVHVDWALADSSHWIEIDANADNYGLITGPHTLDKTNLIRTALGRTSASLQLTSYDVIAIQTGYDPRAGFGQGFPLDPTRAFQTPSGPVWNVVFDGGRNAGAWNPLAHELGHGWLGFEDLYHFTDYQSKPFGKWDLMNDAGSTGVELTVWNRYLAGWITDSQIRCIPKNVQSSSHFISGLTRNDRAIKGVAYLISSGRMVVVESRRVGGFDSVSPTALVYVVDTNIPHGQSPFRLVAELTTVGQTASVSGLTIELLNQSPEGDLVNFQIG
jgi:M6 family metalloprotease-like protein